jgi:hypothetical protein
LKTPEQELKNKARVRFIEKKAKLPHRRGLGKR